MNKDNLNFESDGDDSDGSEVLEKGNKNLSKKNSDLPGKSDIKTNVTPTKVHTVSEMPEEVNNKNMVSLLTFIYFLQH